MADSYNNLRSLPSVDEILRTPTGAATAREFGRDSALRMARLSIDKVRNELNGEVEPSKVLDRVEANLADLQKLEERKFLRRVINATGVIIHTNLGRSPLSKAATDAVSNAASGYCNIEMDLETGERGRRGAAAEKLLAEITGAEDALIVNNCAAAALLVLSALAGRAEVIVSRGELVEIGGDFRIPDVLEISGCIMREVGTTNRTKLSDYKKAVSQETIAILRVHPSNYRITGFTQTPSLDELAELAHQNGLLLIEDAGSGALADLSRFGLGEEPVISRSITAGADIVTFSGDKLAGGVQAGFIVGRKELVKTVRTHPLYRAVRADKIVYAAVEAMIGSYARASCFEEIPVLRMLSMTFTEIDQRAMAVIKEVGKLNIEGLSVELNAGFSAIGGGAGTGVKLETSLIAIEHDSYSADELATALRRAEIPIIARIGDGKVLIDLRTVSKDDEQFVVNAIRSLDCG